MNRRLQRVHIASLRVALMASAILAVVYTVVAAIVVMVVTGSLTSQVDNRLGAVLAAVQNNERITPFTGVTDPSAGAPYTAQLIAWIVRSDGTCQGYAVAPDGHLLPLTNAVLPALVYTSWFALNDVAPVQPCAKVQGYCCTPSVASAQADRMGRTLGLCWPSQGTAA